MYQTNDGALTSPRLLFLCLVALSTLFRGVLSHAQINPNDVDLIEYQGSQHIDTIIARYDGILYKLL